MKFSETTEKDRDFIRLIYTSDELTHAEKMEILSTKFSVTERSIRNWAGKYMGLSGKGVENLPKCLKEASERYLDGDFDILILTGAQNNTPVNKMVWHSITTYIDFLKSKGYKVGTCVAPVSYRNPTSITESSKKADGDWYADEVIPHLYTNKVEFFDTVFCPDVCITPTATNPLSGLEFYANGANAVFAHPRVHFQSMPRFYMMKQYFMCTTGMCTMKNYSRSKAGDKGRFHHSYGFVIVEKKDDKETYPPRNVKINADGSFTDLIYQVSGGEVTRIDRCYGIILGDLHHDHLDDKKMAETERLMRICNPEKVVMHDVLDGSTVNPHETSNLYVRRRKVIEGKYLVQEEIDSVINYLKEFSERVSGDIVVVQSNHDNFLDRWVNSFKVHTDFHNSHTYAKFLHIQQTVDLSENGNLFGYLLSQEGIKYVRSNESYFVGDSQCGYHGEHGVNGSRGSVGQFKKYNFKMGIGHGHTATIVDNVIMVGTSCYIWQDFNSKGLSKGNLADALIHATGHTQLVVYDEFTHKFSNLV